MPTSTVCDQSWLGTFSLKGFPSVLTAGNEMFGKILMELIILLQNQAKGRGCTEASPGTGSRAP